MKFVVAITVTPCFAGRCVTVSAMENMIVVPGLGGSGRDHWQSYWLRDRPGAVRVEQRDWERPDRDEWVAALDDTVARATVPVVLVAHSLGCHTVAHWADRHDAQVRAALLVAPPDTAKLSALPNPYAKNSFAAE